MVNGKQNCETMYHSFENNPTEHAQTQDRSLKKANNTKTWQAKIITSDMPIAQHCTIQTPNTFSSYRPIIST